MPLPLTKRVNRVLKILFEEPLRSRLAKRLEAEAAENIPFHNDSKPPDMDRIRFSILKLVADDHSQEESAFELAKIDWRDLFMAAGFASDANEHETWYQNLTKDDPDESPWWTFWRN
jgi:hypothetical protein